MLGENPPPGEPLPAPEHFSLDRRVHSCSNICWDISTAPRIGSVSIINTKVRGEEGRFLQSRRSTVLYCLPVDRHGGGAPAA